MPRTDDFNGRSQEGVGYYQLTTRNGLRMSAAKAYLAPARRTRQLSIITDAQVTRVVFEGGARMAVVYRRNGGGHAHHRTCAVSFCRPARCSRRNC